MLFFHKVSFAVNTLFPHLRETLYVGRVKLFAEASEFFTHAVLQLLVVGKTASLVFTLQAPKKWKSEDTKSGSQGGQIQGEVSCGKSRG